MFEDGVVFINRAWDARITLLKQHSPGEVLTNREDKTIAIISADSAAESKANLELWLPKVQSKSLDAS